MDLIARLRRDLGTPTIDSEVIRQAADALEAAEAKLARMEEALIWCSGSEDFQDGGKARKGWLKLCAPLIWGEDDGK